MKLQSAFHLDLSTILTRKFDILADPMHNFLVAAIHVQILLPHFLCTLHSETRYVAPHAGQQLLGTVHFDLIHVIKRFIPSDYLVLATVDNRALIGMVYLEPVASSALQVVLFLYELPTGVLYYLTLRSANTSSMYVFESGSLPADVWMSVLRYFIDSHN